MENLNDSSIGYLKESMMIKRTPQVNGVLNPEDINRLMCYYDKQFVELTYKVVLDRNSDPLGLGHHLHNLRDGESRREIVFQIASSDEAKARGVTLDAFRFYPFWRKFQKTPILGSLVLVFVMLMRIRTVIREFRRIQNAVFGIFQELKRCE